MKKILFFSLILFLGVNTTFGQRSIKVGDKASDWSFTDADRKAFSMKNWPNKVLQINYVDPDESDLNEPFNELVKKYADADKIKRANYKAMGIVDCKSSWKPDFAIRLIAGNKAKKYDTTILFDYDAKLRKAWGLKEDSYNVIIVDKNRVVRYVVKDKINDKQAKEMLDLLIKLSNE